LVGKPLKIPFTSHNPENIPGGDQDLLIISPPVLLNSSTTVPIKIDYLASGPDISREDAAFVQDIGNQINAIANNNPILVEIIKNLLERNLQIIIFSGINIILIILFKKIRIY
jgi:hypothetical protein